MPEYFTLQKNLTNTSSAQRSGAFILTTTYVWTYWIKRKWTAELSVISNLPLHTWKNASLLDFKSKTWKEMNFRNTPLQLTAKPFTPLDIYIMKHYVYILRSEKDKKFYVGYTKNLEQRVNYHNSGKVPSTKMRQPLTLIYYEMCLNQQDATHREKYLKTSWGKRYIKSRLKNYLTGSPR